MTDPGTLVLPLSLAIFLIAMLYSSVGHAGASGYIAAMSLVGLAPQNMKPAALALNILVAALAAWQFRRAGFFSWNVFWPFAAGSVPLAFIGGYITLPSPLFKSVIGAVLVYSALRFFFSPKSEIETTEPSATVSAGMGAGIGFVSGLTGVGGGIFLTPLLIFFRWAKTKTASAVSAAFILVNSIAGLAGNIAGTGEFISPAFVFPLAAAAIAGGSIGSFLGSRRFTPTVIKILLGIVLLIAGVRLVADGVGG